MHTNKLFAQLSAWPTCRLVKIRSSNISNHICKYSVSIDWNVKLAALPTFIMKLSKVDYACWHAYYIICLALHPSFGVYSWIYNIHVRTLLSLVVTTGALTRICFSNNYTLILNWAKVKSYQKGGAVKILGMQWLIEVDTHLLWIVNIDIIHVDLKTSSFLSIAPYMYM